MAGPTTTPDDERGVPSTARRPSPTPSWPGRPVAAGYLAAQAAVGVALWVVWATVPDVRAAFELDADRPEVMDAFVLADLLVAVVSSAVGARLVWRSSSAAVPVVAFAAGTIVYPTAWLLGWVALAGTGAACLAIMLPPALLSCWVAWQTWRSLGRTPT